MSRFLDVLEVSPLPDGEQWRINAHFRYQSDIAGLIVVQRRFVTDFTSIPRVIQNIYPPWGLYGSAAIVHDMLYWKNSSKEQADSVLREAMAVLGVPQDTITKIYAAVHMLGQTAWDRNAELRKNGYTRMAGTGSNPPYADIPDLPGV